jgi:cupin superfamily acireductone dioxygenase involved in methionine salvage
MIIEIERWEVEEAIAEWLEKRHVKRAVDAVIDEIVGEHELNDESTFRLTVSPADEDTILSRRASIHAGSATGSA